jgi:hypothetical protein
MTERQRLRQKRLRALAEAYNEAAGHLELNWTEDATEAKEGRKLARRFYKQWERLMDRADDLE